MSFYCCIRGILSHCAVDETEDGWAWVEVAKRFVAASGVNAVAKEDIYQFTFRIYPETCTGETDMPECGG